MKISSVYITKNEEKNIIKSIQSYKNIVDEIIVVDTGSTDNTIEVCKQYGCKIYNYKWDNDFAKARNYAISLCNNDIILFLDADEYFFEILTQDKKDKIIQIFAENSCDAIGCLETDIDKNTEIVHHTSYAYKFFRKSKDLRFEGKIHESLRHSERELNIILTDEFQIIHTGYSSDIILSKVKRNLEILNSIEDKKIMDFYYLGRENLSLQNYAEGEKNFGLFFQSKDVKKILHSNNLAYMAYFYKLIIMEHMPDEYSKKDMLNWLFTAKEEFPYIPEIYYNLGKMYFQFDVKIAEKYFKEAIKKNEEFIGKHYEINNFPEFQPKIYYYLSLIYLYQDKKDEAIQKAIVACMLNTKDKQNFGLLLHLLNRIKTKENIDLIQKIYRPKTKEDYEFITSCLANTNLYKEFVYFANIYNQQFNGGNDCLYYAMMLTENYEIALDSLSHFDNEKKNFIATVVILFANSSELLEKYFETISDEYIDILNVLVRNDFTINVDTQKLTNVICKLLNYGVIIPKVIIDYLVNNLEDNQILQIINTLENNNEYIQALEFLQKFVNCKNKKSKEIISEYLFLLYMNKNYNEFVQTYSKYCNYNVQGKLLNLIRNKLLTKENIKIKNKLQKRVKEYAKI